MRDGGDPGDRGDHEDDHSHDGNDLPGRSPRLFFLSSFEGECGGEKMSSTTIGARRCLRTKTSAREMEIEMVVIRILMIGILVRT